MLIRHANSQNQQAKSKRSKNVNERTKRNKSLMSRRAPGSNYGRGGARAAAPDQPLTAAEVLLSTRLG